MAGINASMIKTLMDMGRRQASQDPNSMVLSAALDMLSKRDQPSQEDAAYAQRRQMLEAIAEQKRLQSLANALALGEIDLPYEDRKNMLNTLAEKGITPDLSASAMEKLGAGALAFLDSALAFDMIPDSSYRSLNPALKTAYDVGDFTGNVAGFMLPGAALKGLGLVGRLGKTATLGERFAHALKLQSIPIAANLVQDLANDDTEGFGHDVGSAAWSLALGTMMGGKGRAAAKAAEATKKAAENSKPLQYLFSLINEAAKSSGTAKMKFIRNTLGEDAWQEVLTAMMGRK